MFFVEALLLILWVRVAVTPRLEFLDFFLEFGVLEVEVGPAPIELPETSLASFLE
jgi:hypothetical protein